MTTRPARSIGERLDAAGVRPADVRHREDLERIPFMEKTEIAESQAGGELLGVNQCAPLEGIVRIQATGGTTGQPMRIGLTRRDIADYGEMGARGVVGDGLSPGEIVFECMNYNLYSGGLSDHLTFETRRRGDHPVRRRSQRAAAHDDGRHRRPGRHLGDAVVRRPARRGGRRARHRPAVGRAPSRLLLG